MVSASWAPAAEPSRAQVAENSAMVERSRLVTLVRYGIAAGAGRKPVFPALRVQRFSQGILGDGRYAAVMSTRLRPLAIATCLAVWALALPSCVPFEDEDGRVCANASCAVGFCYSDHGSPACACSAWELAAGLSCVGVFPVGGLNDHLLEVPTDSGAIPEASGTRLEEDFHFVATAGLRYSLSLSSVTRPAPITITALGPDGSRQDTHWGGEGQPPSMTFIVGGSGPALIRVIREADSSGAVPGYAYFFLQTDPRDAAADIAHASPIGPGTTPVTFEVGTDVDVYQFTASAGRVYALSSTPAFPFTVTDASGATVATSQNIDVDARTFTGVLLSRSSQWTGYLRFEHQSQAAFQDYAINIADVGADFGGSPEVPQVAPLGTTVSGRIDTPDDVDVFQIPQIAGHVYVAKPVKGQVNATPSWGSSTVWVSTGAPATLTVTGVNDGASRPLIANYSFQVDDWGADEAGETADTAKEVAATAYETNVSGHCAPAGDLDAYSFTPVAGHLYELICTGAGCTLSGTWTDADRPEVVGSSLVILTASSSSPLTVFVAGAPSYSLTLRNLGTDDYPDDPLQATLIPLNTRVPAQIAYDLDVDQFAVQLEGGQQYSLWVQYPPLLQSFIDLGAQGTVPPNQAFTAPQTGTYVVTVKADSSVSYLQTSYALEVDAVP